MFLAAHVTRPWAPTAQRLCLVPSVPAPEPPFSSPEGLLNSSLGASLQVASLGRPHQVPPEQDSLAEGASPSGPGCVPGAETVVVRKPGEGGARRAPTSQHANPGVDRLVGPSHSRVPQGGGYVEDPFLAQPQSGS